MTTKIDDIRQDPVITRLLEKMPRRVADSFDDEQLAHLRNAIGAREWGRHRIDLRGTVKLAKWRYYYVILAGRNRRSLSDQQLKLARLLTVSLIAGFTAIAILVGLVVLYLIKSALGINLIDGWSLGLWSWFETTFL